MEEPEPLLRDDDSVDYRSVEGADGLHRADLISEADGAPNFELRKYVVEPGVEVGKHRNAIEHEQYVLAGEYTLGIGDEEYRVSTGYSAFIPAGTVHWYRNDTEAPATYLCVVPIGDEGTEFLE
jgi:quercetin dioxygenase-like cupin family protein